MPSSGDSGRWATLPGAGSSDSGDSGLAEAPSNRGAIGSLSATRARDTSAGTVACAAAIQPSPDGTSLTVKLGRLTLAIAHDPAAGLAHRVWPSSVVLASRALEEGGGAGLEGTWALELGCGPGLAGVAWAAAGARVILTDLEPCLPLAARSIQLSGVGARAIAVRLGWGEPGAVGVAGAAAAAAGWVDLPSSATNAAAAASASAAAVPDLLLAADCVYDPALFAPLLATLAQFGRAGTHRVLLAHVRRWRTDRRFWAAARQEWEVVDVTRGGGEDGGDGGRRSSSHERGAQRLFELRWKGAQRLGTGRVGGCRKAV